MGTPLIDIRLNKMFLDNWRRLVGAAPVQDQIYIRLLLGATERLRTGTHCSIYLRTNCNELNAKEITDDHAA
jgi:hypothetical protein